MKNILLFISFSTIAMFSSAQNGDDSYTFLRYPSSSRANALGGHTVSLIENDPSLALHNPGLLGSEMDGMVSLSYMNYISDINVGSVFYTKAAGERGAWGIGATYLSYGQIKQTNAENIEEGTFSANDVNINGIYAYDLSERWRGGLSLKFLYSSFERYSSFGIGVDAGLSYYNSEEGISFGFAIKNIGAQIKAYNEERHKLPWDIQLGMSKKMQNSPFRYSITAMHLNKWNLEYIDNSNASTYEGDSFFQSFTKHLVFGVDYIPSDNFWIGLGFNPKSNADMKLINGNRFGGFSIGAGVSLSSFNVAASLAQYHPSASSLMISVSTSLSKRNIE
jgi:hypothetical protein